MREIVVGALIVLAGCDLVEKPLAAPGSRMPTAEPADDGWEEETGSTSSEPSGPGLPGGPGGTGGWGESETGTSGGYETDTERFDTEGFETEGFETDGFDTDGGGSDEELPELPPV